MSDLLDEVGWVQQVLVNQNTGFVVDGHMRVAVALKHGQAEVPVTLVDLTDEEEAQVLATLNPLGALAYEDTEARNALLAQTKIEREALRSLTGQFAPSEAPESGLDQTGERDGMERDHTKAIAEGDDSDDEEYDLGAWQDDAYTGEAIKLINFIMTVPEYEDTIDALERIGDREGLETNADVVLWLIDQYRPEAVA